MRWVEHVARMGDRKGAYRVFVGRFDGKRQLNLQLYVTIILKCTFKKRGGET
jgi:hypothetical protein